MARRTLNLFLKFEETPPKTKNKQILLLIPQICFPCRWVGMVRVCGSVHVCQQSHDCQCRWIQVNKHICMRVCSRWSCGKARPGYRLQTCDHQREPVFTKREPCALHWRTSCCRHNLTWPHLSFVGGGGGGENRSRQVADLRQVASSRGWLSEMDVFARKCFYLSRTACGSCC